MLAPLRRVIPPVGMFDLSFTVLVFGLLILLAGGLLVMSDFAVSLDHTDEASLPLRPWT